MARPPKNGLDYFPMDVDTDEKFELIEAKHGLIGFGIIVKLYQRIYKLGYYIDWSDEKVLIFKKSINVDINTINDVINDCLKYDIFDNGLYKKHKILTSSGIQKRYLQACERRKILELCKNFIIVDINAINVDINWINTINSTQSKGEYIKEEKSKEYKKILLSEIKISDFEFLNTDYYKIAISFYELFKSNLTEAGATLVNIEKAKGTWIDDIRLIIETDKYELSDLRDVYVFLQRSDFWKKNILSTSKLRAQMDKLKLQIKNEQSTNQNGGVRPATGRNDASDRRASVENLKQLAIAILQQPQPKND